MFRLPLFLMLLPCFASAESVHRIALPEVRVVGQLPPRVAAALSQALPAELRKLEGVSVMTAKEITELLSLERQRQLMGCKEDETSCLTEIAGALDAHDLVTFEIADVARKYTVSLKRFDAKRGRLLESFTRAVDRGDGEELLSLVGPAVAALYGDRPLRAGRTRGVDVALARRLNPPPLPVWSFLATSGAAVTALGGGAVFGLLTQESQRDLDALIDRSRNGSAVSAREIEIVYQRGSERALWANALFGAGAALGLAAGVQALFTDWHGLANAPPGSVTAGLMPQPSGGFALVIGGSL